MDWSNLCIFDICVIFSPVCIFSGFWKYSRLNFTDFNFLYSVILRLSRLWNPLQSAPEEKSLLIRTFLNDTTISSTRVDSIHGLFKPKHIHKGVSVGRRWGLPRRPRRTLRLITSPTWHPVSIWASASIPSLGSVL